MEDNNVFPRRYMMKGKILLLFFIMIMLSACQSSSPPTTLNDETQFITQGQPERSSPETLFRSMGNFELSGKFYDEMIRNPIDHDYEMEFNELQNSKEIITTLDWGAFEGKYEKIWDEELNHIYEKLLSKLDRESREALIESQKEWLKYNLKETKFVEKTYIDTGYLGSKGSVSLAKDIMERIRERTMQLMEYRYLLDGEVEFSYQSNN